ncbi:hypothetical protein PR003_g29271 [Phytophthora rubi]|uniref:Uncharacterized protein n=1 Tax=Phytophthora rubi TaxID=129364 RepID=A0A6A4BJ04_9STRA|nr:hypothetical protein PR003_g29271 [Phytophthora rubi]
MAKSKKDMRDAGREGREREEATRSSRRADGLPPEEHASLEEVVRTARKAGAAKRKAAREEKKSLSQDQPAAEPPVQDDAHQVSGDSEAGGELETGQGEPSLGEPEVASVGGVDVDESQVESRGLDSPLPDQDVSVRAPTQDVPLPTVLEDVSGENTEALALLEEKAPPNVQLSAIVQKDAVPSSQRLSDDAAKAYVAKQVSRWEQVRSERVLPPSVQYDWPNSRPDSLPWLAATVATSKYMAARATLGDAIQACVVELNLDRRDLATAQDVVAAEIPVGIFSPRECVAVLQTLLFEAGFHFDNFVPVWFKTHASKITADLVRSLVGDLQRLLAAELTKWRTLCVGATLKMTPAIEQETEAEETPILDYHAED